MIHQIQTWKDACHAIEVGADIIVAQGSEAGGHRESRGTMTLVPEIADEIAKRNTDVSLVATGGIADGQRLAESIALGADGVVVIKRYWASKEAPVHPRILANSLPRQPHRFRVLDYIKDSQWSLILRRPFVDHTTKVSKELIIP